LVAEAAAGFSGCVAAANLDRPGKASLRVGDYQDLGPAGHRQSRAGPASGPRGASPHRGGGFRRGSHRGSGAIVRDQQNRCSRGDRCEDSAGLAGYQQEMDANASCDGPGCRHEREGRVRGVCSREPGCRCGRRYQIRVDSCALASHPRKRDEVHGRRFHVSRGRKNERRRRPWAIRK
jgi:hypothetical protein